MQDFIDLSNFEITNMESEEFSFNCFKIKNSETLPHWHGHIEIVYVSKGVCSVFINGELYTCCQGDIIVIPQNSLHSIIPENTSTYHPIIIGEMLLKQTLEDLHFQSSLSFTLAEKSFSPIHISVIREHYDDFVMIIKRIFNEYETKNVEYRTIIKLEIIKLFTLIKRYDTDIQTYPAYKKNERTRIIIKVLEYISNHYSDKISVKSMSSFSNMSEQHFCRVFKAYTGKTLIEFVTLIRLDKSYRLIIDTDIPITQIPELTGFCNENYFSRIFKKHYGFSPSQLRKANI